MSDGSLEGIAIIGMAGRFPGARNVGEFWSKLAAGEEMISTIDGPATAGAGAYIPRRGLIEKPEWFDAAFFGISPREAEVMDPQQRVFLEECWNALEDAACDPSRYRGAIGVFAGMSNNTYWSQNLVHHPDLTASVGWLTAMMANEKDYLATRVAYKLNLRGPALNIYTACSTSLVAVCQAVQGLLNYSCDVALAGGISITFPHERGYHYDEGGILSPDGHCRPFDTRAGGTVFSNGAGVVVLKRLAEAVADRDQIYAVIKGAALNNDGSGKVSFTAPSVDGHAEVIALAQALGGIEPGTIGYVEAHGTGTPLGDPIEIAGLTQAFRAGTAERQFCAIGSVKSNIGHLDAAAGIAGLIKTALILKHGRIPASLHFTEPNPALGLPESPFFVASEARDWPQAETPRRAGVSSFGVGGTNAHVVLEECPPIPSPDSAIADRRHLLVLSAKSEAALAQRAIDLADYLEANPGACLRDVAFTLQKGRAELAIRRAFLCPNREIAISALRGFEPKRTHHGSAGSGGVVFMFPGQGAQYPAMGAQLYASEPVFREAFDQCADAVQSEVNLRAAIGVEPGATAANEAELRETRLTQPIIFAVSYAIARLWMSIGVQAAACIGHSVGEYVAAALAGVFSLEDAIRLVAARARLVHELPAGSMLAARLPEAEAMRFVSDRIALAAVNGPRLVVLAGEDCEIAEVEAQLAQESIACKRLETSRAFHSPMVDPVITPLAELVAACERRAPMIRIFSTVTANWLSEDEAVSPGYWARHARETVRFAPAIAQLLAGDNHHFIECGPGQTLTQLARQHAAPDRSVCTSIRDGLDELASFYSAVGQLWARGATVNWDGLQATASARKISLPGYPFERKRFFAEAPSVALLENTPELPAIDFAETPADLAPAMPLAAESALAAPRKDILLGQLFDELQRLSGVEFAGISANLSFIELGFDSLFLTQLAVAIQKRFGAKITFRQLLQDLNSPEAVAAHLDANLPADAAIASPPSSFRPASPAPAPHPHFRAHGPFRGIETAMAGELQAAQRAHLDDLIARYSERAAGSKRFTAEHRKHLADPRAVAGFRREWKELIFPLVCDRSEGSRIWDIDGNEYIDITLGFGQILFGHRPIFLVEALERQLQRGIEIGPTSPLAGSLAERLSKYLDFDRVAFCNTGSEAVAAALRVARTVTGRDRVAVFSGGYHGIFDEVLFRAGPAPIAPGIPHSAVENLVVLEYGADEALEWLKSNMGSLAAVLVEPVQSRNPALVPVDFLKEIRRISMEQGTALIFDEIVTGFRVAPGGAQEYFGIRADLATYGKVIGGGFPVGIVAGKREYMDALDGGAWQYGDDSFPEAGVTFFAGTFVRHPLALAAVSAILDHLEQSGPALQQELGSRAAALAGAMNGHLETCGVPLRWEQFTSLYHLPIPPELRFAPLIFAHMRLRGFHIWENRPCFLCAAHTAEEITRVAVAFCESVNALIESGLLPGRSSLIEISGLAAQLTVGESALIAPKPSALRRLPPEERDPLKAPTTDSQRELLAAAQLGTDANSAFNDAIALRARGSLDRAVLESALAKVVARHEALRAAFTEDLREQIIQPAIETSVHFTDLSDLESAAQAAALDAAAEVGATTPFRLDCAPLWRAELFKLAPEEHEFRFTAHHAICDGWSFGLIASELAAIYTSEVRGEDPRIPEAKSFQSHSLAEKSQEASEGFILAERWWAGQFDPAPAFLDLPLDHPRSGKRTFAAASVSSALPRSVAESLRATAAQMKATPYSVLLAAFAVLLRRLSGQGDVVVGIASAGQATAAGPLVGHCVSFLPVRICLGEAETFASVVTAASERLLDAREHSAVTFGRILQKLSIPREPGRIPLTAVSFNVDRAPGKLAFGESCTEFRPLPKHRYHLELSFNLLESEDGYRLDCHFNRDLFAPHTVERWLRHYASLLESAIRMPQCAVAELPLLDARESARILVAWNQTERDYPRDHGIDTLFEAVAAKQPDATAITYGQQNVSYGELNRQANLLADRLNSSGVAPGSLVGICVERSTDLVVASLAILKAGCAYVPFDPSWPAERLATMTKAAALATVVTRLEHARHFPGQALLLDGPKPPAHLCCDDPNVATSGATPACVIFTSGSTGAPKGVVVPHRAIARLVLQTDYAQLTPEDAVGHASNPAFDAATFEIWGPLLNGGRIVILGKSTMLNAKELRRAIESERITTLFLTTALFNQLASADARTFEPLRCLLVGGDVANPAAMARVLREGAPGRLLNIYGPTEVTTFACAYQVKEPPAENSVVPIGRPIANTRAYILDDHQQAVPVGVPGELYLGGDGVALGYHGQDELSAERFLNDPFCAGGRIYRTGDRAKWREDGQIEFLGRIDGQIKLRGFRIELGEIEFALCRHPAIRASAIKVIGKGAEDKSLAAYIVPRNGNAPTPDELRSFLNRRLPEYMIPRAFVALSELPLTPNGKIDRAALPLPKDNAVPRPGAPRSPMEAKVAEMMSATLGVPSVAANDDFFLLGGHSLLAMDLMARLRKAFGVEVPASVLFESPNVSGLAKYIAEHQPQPETRAAFRYLVPIQRGAPGRPALFLVAGGWGGEIEFLVYAQIGRLLGSDQPIWGLKARGAGTADPPHGSVSEMAADYLAEIRALQPCGPYWIAGECVGGICAHEMACQLRDAGEAVAALILLDTSVPNPDELADYLAEEERKRASEVQRLTFAQRVSHHWKHMQSVSLGGKVAYLARKALRLPAPPAPASEAQHPRGQASYPPTLMRHRLRPYAGTVTLLVDEESFALHGQLGWERAAVGGLDLHVLPGSHLSYIREEGANAARKLQELLAESSLRS